MLAALTVSLALPATFVAALPDAPDRRLVDVIVAEAANDERAEEAVRGAGGEVGRSLSLVGGFAARIPAVSLADVAAHPSVADLWRDGTVTMSSSDGRGVERDSQDDPECDDDECDVDGLERYDPLPPNGVWRAAVGLTRVPSAINGDGVTVAVLDTGVTLHPDLDNRVLARVDLTPDGGGYDTFGHGTHMTGLVAGSGALSGGRWAGAAPGADVVPIRMAEWNGAVDVSQVLYAMEWIHNNAATYGIRVLNLSFGTDSTQNHQLDPLNHAVQRLWGAGIVVVAAAGNRGLEGDAIDKPGDDPYVVTVGAADTKGTVTTVDDVVADFSSRGPTRDGVTKPDLVAPGISIVSQRAAGSTLDEMRPAARLNDWYTKGHGTSQATAIVSGTVALMLQAAPRMTPDEVKATLVGTADRALAGQPGGGAGLVDAAAAVRAARQRAYSNERANVGLTSSSGTGMLDSTRGSAKPFTDLDGDGTAEQVAGEIDVIGTPFDSAAWAARPWNPETAPDSPWAPYFHVSPGWQVTPWTPEAWPGLGWNELTWTAQSWRETALDPATWTAQSWRDNGWN